MNRNTNKTLLLGAMAMTLGMTSCVDENYDLSDLDTTIGIEVKNLTIAMNLDEIKLEKVMDLSDDSQIKEIIDPSTGNKIYAVLEEGTFESDPISISSFTADAPTINPIQDALPLKYISEQVNSAIDVEINKAVDEEIDRMKPELIAQYQKQYNDEKQKYVDEAIRKLEEEYAPYPIPGDMKSEVEAEVEAKMVEYVGFKYEDIEEKVTDEVEAQREDIKEKQRNSPEIRAKAKEIAWNYITDEDEEFVKYDISDTKTSFSTESNDVDKALRSLEHITATSTIKLVIQLTNLSNILEVVIQDVKLQLPKGLELTIEQPESSNPNNAEYNMEDGILSLGNVTLKNGHYELDLHISGIDIAKSGIVFTPKADAPGSFAFSNTVGVISGDVKITKKSFINGKTIFDLPDEASYICQPSMSEIKIAAVTGEIEYEIDEPQIDPVNINDLPDLLTDEETNIFLGNPQIYLSMNNPLYTDNIVPQLGLEITPIRNSGAGEPCGLDNEIIRLEKEQNVLCLSPAQPEKYYGDFTEATHERYTKLGSILSGKGLPKRLEIKVVDPQIVKTNVTNFHIGRDIEPVKGEYTFYAPLSLADNSLIVYRDTVNGWHKDLEKMSIHKLQLDAKLISTLPVGANLTIKPIDMNGNELRDVECNSISVEAKNGEQSIQFNLTSTNGMKDLDGIVLHATIVGNNPGTALSPEQTIKVTSAKVTVSGQYVEPDKD